ncbi:decanoate-CoA ligase [Aureococcus anophagefferens]|nr:decanoate-CoA ligase [Aureococcus anophagefferens]
MRDLMREEMGAIGHYPTAPVRSLAILPWAHIYGQTIELHGMTAAGHEVAVATDPTTFLAEVAEAKPDCLFAVPALYNREVRDFMDACGVPMTNGYGLTETSPVLTKEKPPSYGDNRPYNVALLALDWVAVAEKFGKAGSVAMPAPYLFEPAAAVEGLLEAHGAELKALLADEIAAHSSGFKNFELPEKFAILTEGFNLKRGMVTPKMSVKRPAVFAAHEADVTPPHAEDDCAADAHRRPPRRGLA